MKTFKYWLPILFFFLSNNVLSQTCLPDGIIFTSQTEIDNFANDYPNCTEILGDVIIDDLDDVTNLDGLNNITFIGGDLVINSSSSLSDLSGIGNLNGIGGSLDIRSMHFLSSLDGLNNLTSVGNDVIIHYNNQLNSLSALNNLNSIGGSLALTALNNVTSLPQLINTTIGGSISITLSSLTSLDGFPSISTINGDLKIQSCSTIVNMQGLENLVTINGELLIKNCTSLVNFVGLEFLTNINGRFGLYSNENLISLNNLDNLFNIESFVSSSNNLGSLNGLENIYQLNDLSITYEDYLQNLSPLNNLITVTGDLTVYNSDNLSSLGLNSLESVGGDFQIKQNDDLASIQSLVNLTNVGGELDISFNESISNLNGLNNLTSINGDFTISANEVLNNIEALNNLNHISGDFSIGGIQELTNLSGFENLDTIGGDFTISGFDPLTNLDLFEELDYIGYNLEISSNDGLVDLSGLENITSIYGGMTIQNNEQLSSLQALNNISEIGSTFRIVNNKKLTDLSGLENLTSIGYHFWIGPYPLNNSASHDSIVSLAALSNLNQIGGILHIDNCNELESLQGLESLTTVGSHLRIYDSHKLNNLIGLESLTTVNGSFQIDNCNGMTSLAGLGYNVPSQITQMRILYNDTLSLCSETFVCNYIANGGDVVLGGNATGCTTIQEIQNSCNDVFSKVTFDIFHDLNQNLQRDSGEFIIPNTGISVAPLDVTIFSNSSATTGGIFFLDEGNYNINYISDLAPNWDLLSDSTINLTIDSTYSCEEIVFAVYPNSIVSEMTAVVNSTFTRCGFMSKFTTTAQNTGTTITDGTLWLDIDDNIDSIIIIDSPDTINGTLYGWHFENLFPGQFISNEIKFRVPLPQNFPIGNALDFESYIEFSDAQGSSISSSFDYHPTVLCAYDPNDKLVSPNREDHLTLFESELIYTVRFQNTGNAAAIDVELRDTLNPNLDPTTFMVLSTSHPHKLTTSMESDQYLSFYFDNIYLPDSTTNFDASQGFVTYRIKAKDGIPEETNITNTASIYFDFNPPIVTNTTESIMVSEIFEDSDGDGFLSNVDCDDTNPNINPNMSEITYNGLDDDCNPITLDDDLDQDGFLLADDCDDTNSTINPDMSEITYNGLDDDCNSQTLDDDLDQDGFLLADDCDDTNPDINPNAEEIPNNNIDEDCDGMDLIVGTNNLNGESINIYPNPVVDFLFVKKETSQIYLFEIIDLTGRLISEGKIINNLHSIPFSEMNAGIYFVKIIDSETEQFIVEKIIK